MVKVLGLDIGGANIKAAYLKADGRRARIVSEYFPIWQLGKDRLPSVLRKLKQQLAGEEGVDVLGVTMTAELSDVYQSKHEGVNHILSSVERVFPGVVTYVLDVEGKLSSLKVARHQILHVASANWAATGWLVSQRERNCLIVDVGSTTTSIIPIFRHRVATLGRTDLEKLANGELVYTGALRTSVATVVDTVPLRGRKVRVSSEYFASTGDVHLILGNITSREYTVETPDGRGCSRREAETRLARIVCADREMLTSAELQSIAEYIAEKQMAQIVHALRQVLRRSRSKACTTWMPIVVSGLGRNFLSRKAALKVGFNHIIDLGVLLGAEAAKATPALAVALMVQSRLERGEK